MADVEDKIWRKLDSSPIPKEWDYRNKQLRLELDQDANVTFHPAFDPLRGHILLETATHSLRLNYEAPNQQNCWHLYRKKNSSWVSVQPLSAKWPSRPSLTVSSISLFIEIICL